MKSFQLDQLQKDAEAWGERYFEFLRVPALSAGIYHLASNSQDPQGPHKRMRSITYYQVALTSRLKANAKLCKPAALFTSPH